MMRQPIPFAIMRTPGLVAAGVLAILLLRPPLQAQTPQPPLEQRSVPGLGPEEAAKDPLVARRDQDVARELEKWREALGLADDQTAAIRELLREEHRHFEIGAASIDREPEAAVRSEMAAELGEHLESFDARFDAVLTPWQCRRPANSGSIMATY